MTPKSSQRLVVDASVAKAAGETNHPVSSACRETLMAILEVCHRVVMTQSLQAEWNNHASYISKKWLSSMTAKKKVIRLKEADLTQIKIDSTGLTVVEKEAIEKDRHLVQGAAAYDGIIITLDKKIIKNKDRFQSPKPIRWINPETDGYSCIGTL